MHPLHKKIRNRLRRFYRHYGWVILAASVQVCFWSQTWQIRPEMGIVPDVPTVTMASAFAFGDGELYFRVHALDIQNSGWTYGRSTTLDQFDYRKLYHWFKLLDSFNDHSDFVPYMASYWYSRTEKVPDVKYMVDYLYEFSVDRLDTKWRWMVEALSLADYKLHDGDLALQIAIPLEKLHNVPIIVRQLPAFVYERRGDMDKARKVMEEIRADSPNLPAGELKFMSYFIEERLKQRNDTTLYYDKRSKIQRINTKRADDPEMMNRRKIYNNAEIRAFTFEGLKVGMTQDEATKVLQSNHWEGEWRPYKGTGVEYPFRKDGHDMWLFRIKGADNKMRIWMITYREQFREQQDFRILTYIITGQYGDPSDMNINPYNSAYVYYHTQEKHGAPKMNVEMTRTDISFQLSDESMIPEEFRPQ